MSDLPNLACMAAEKWPGEEAVIDAERSLTFRQFADMMGAMSARLTNLGVQASHRAAIIVENDWRTCLLIWSLINIGAVACPLSTRLPAAALKLHLGELAVDFLIDPDLRLAAEDCGQVRALHLEEVVKGADVITAATPIPKAFDADAQASIIYTSGSSSRPRAALHTYTNHYYSALGSNDNIPVGPGDRWLLSLPIYHVGGLAILFRCLLGGGTVVVPNRSETLAANVEKYRITHLSVVSTQLMRLIQEAPKYDVSCLKAVLAGGSAMPSNLIDEGCRRELPLYTSYGNTEGASQITTSPAEASENVLKTSGRVLKHREISIDANDEILIKGKTLGRGYVRGRNVEDFADCDGWFHTGDTGRIDADGSLTVIGRRDNMFVSGGENIQPEEIERIICAMPNVIEAAVVPRPDENYGFRPVAFVRAGEGVDLDVEAVAAGLRRLLPGFKIPDSILPWPEKTTTLSMKVDRRALMRLAEKSREAGSGD